VSIYVDDATRGSDVTEAPEGARGTWYLDRTDRLVSADIRGVQSTASRPDRAPKVA
jgi:hypothetical protein